MQRKFITNLALLQSLNWLVKPLWIFGIDRLAQIQLGNEWYGRYYVLFSFALLFNILLDFGLNNYVSARVGKDGKADEALPVLKLRLWLSGGFIVLVLILGLWQKFDPLLLGLVIANQLIAGFVLFFRSILQGLHRFKRDSLVSVTDRLVAILVLGLILFQGNLSGREGVIVFLLAQTAGYLAALVFSFFSVSDSFGKSLFVRVENSAELLKSTAWFAVLAFAMSVFTRIDAVMIRNLAPGGVAEAGVYAQSFRLLDAALIFSSLISTMLLPLFTRLIANRESTDKLVWLNVRIIFFAVLPAVATAWFFPGEILNWLYGKSYASSDQLEHAAVVFTPLISCFLPMAVIHIYGTYLTAAGNLRYLAAIAVGSVLLNIAVNAITIPSYGAEAAAWTCLATQTVFAVLCLIPASLSGAQSFQPTRLFPLAIWVLLTVGVFEFASEEIGGLTGFFAACAGFLVATIVSGIFFGEMMRLLGFQGMKWNQ